jgi:hypothetical protein
VTGLTIPDVAGMDTLTAALAYAKDGFYVGWHRRRTKNPGSLMGDDWQHKTTRDPQVLTAMLAGTDHGIFLHMGRSGAIAIDVDTVNELVACPPLVTAIEAHIRAGHPVQQSRPRRWHYVFTQPPGRNLGNSKGHLTGNWGEIRGRNGVIVAAPTPHPEGGEYRWLTTGPVPELPAALADLLPDTADAEDAATDAEVAAFLAAHTARWQPHRLELTVADLEKRISAGAARHDEALIKTCLALKEAARGFFPAAEAVRRIGEVFTAAACREVPRRKTRTRPEAASEYAGIVAWAIGQMPVSPQDRQPSDDGETGETWRDSDGAQLLDEVHAFITRFVAFPSEAAAHAVTLWAAHCHVPDSFESTPRIALLSPEPGSGKTRTLEVLELLTPDPQLVLSASPASIFRLLKKGPLTLLHDEVDAVFTKHGKDDTNEDLRALLNAGHRKGATIPRCVGPSHDVQMFPVFAPVALAGLGDLPATLMSRSVVIRMRRRAPGETVEPFRVRLATADAKPLAGQLAAWMKHTAPRLADSYPEMPPGITDRPADVWEPLLAVADAAGGDWPKRARAACTELAAAAETAEASLGVRLLTDLWEVFGKYEDQDGQPVRTGTAKQLPTAVILDRLRALDEAPWASLGKPPKPLDSRGLANRLRAYSVKSDNLPRDDGGTRLKGYFAASLADAWMRYVPESRTSAPSAPSSSPQADDLFAGADTGPGAAPSAPPDSSAPPDDPVTSADTDGADGADVRGTESPHCGECGVPISALRYAQAGPVCGRCEATESST